MGMYPKPLRDGLHSMMTLWYPLGFIRASAFVMGSGMAVEAPLDAQLTEVGPRPALRLTVAPDLGGGAHDAAPLVPLHLLRHGPEGYRRSFAWWSRCWRAFSARRDGGGAARRGGPRVSDESQSQVQSNRLRHRVWKGSGQTATPRSTGQ